MLLCRRFLSCRFARTLRCGSVVNQHGEVQAIGGLNVKIEGFFDICRARGVTGNQGSSFRKRMFSIRCCGKMRIDACAAKRFFVYPIGTIDEGIVLLTGCPPAEGVANGLFTDSSAQ